MDILPTTSYLSWLYIGTRLTLPAHTFYAVNVSMLLSTRTRSRATIYHSKPTESIWIRSWFADNNNCTTSSQDIIGRNYLVSWAFASQNGTFAMLQGSILLKNTNNSPKTCHYCVGRVERWGNFSGTIYRFGGDYWAENQIYAVPING